MRCPHRAVLIITREVTSTSTEIARDRIELTCSRDEGHDGAHEDGDRGEQWHDRGEAVTHVIRHEVGES